MNPLGSFHCKQKSRQERRVQKSTKMFTQKCEQARWPSLAAWIVSTNFLEFSFVQSFRYTIHLQFLIMSQWNLWGFPFHEIPARKTSLEKFERTPNRKNRPKGDQAVAPNLLNHLLSEYKETWKVQARSEWNAGLRIPASTLAINNLLSVSPAITF